MNKKEILEIKHRFRKNSCTITHFAGCYVNSGKEKLCTFSENFLAQEDEEFYKYLDIASKCLSGTLGNQLIELEFPLEEEATGGHQHLLMALRESRLSDSGLLDAFYDQIIASYDCVGNYLILLFHDVYDIPMKTSDQLNLGDSEETYEYIVCAICPVALSKAGLGYREEENRIGARIRDWVVGPVDTAFTFPCFTDRSTDIHSILLYGKNPGDPHKELWENGLGCSSTGKFTSTEKRRAFTNMITQAIGPENEETPDVIIDVTQGISDYVESKAEEVAPDEQIVLTSKIVTDIMADSGVPEQKAEKIAQSFDSFFEEAPEAMELVDTKILKNNEIRVEKNELKKKVTELTDKLEEAGVINRDGSEISIVVRVPKDKREEVTTGFVDGRKCILIPIDGSETVTINGEKQ